MLPFVWLMILASVNKAVSMHMTFQQLQTVVSVGCQGKFDEHCDIHQKGLRQTIRQHRAMIQESAMLYTTSAYDFVPALAVYLHMRGQDSARQIWDGHDKCLLSTIEAKTLPWPADLTTDHDTVLLQCECSRNLPKINSAILHQLQRQHTGYNAQKGALRYTQSAGSLAVPCHA